MKSDKTTILFDGMKKIGAGTYGIVYKALLQLEDGETMDIALKILK